MEKQNDHKDFQRKYGCCLQEYCNLAIVLFAGIKNGFFLEK